MSSLIGGVGGFLSGRAQRGFEKKRHKSISRLFDTLDSQFGQEYGAARRDYQRSLQDIQGGYDAGKFQLERSARSSISEAKTAGEVLSGQQTQSDIDRGIYNTSIASDNRRGISMDTQRIVAGVRQTLAQAMAGLETQRGRAVADARSNLGAAAERRFGVRAGLTGNRIGYLQGRPNMGYSALGDVLSGIGRATDGGGGEDGGDGLDIGTLLALFGL